MLVEHRGERTVGAAEPTGEVGLDGELPALAEGPALPGRRVGDGVAFPARDEAGAAPGSA